MPTNIHVNNTLGIVEATTSGHLTTEKIQADIDNMMKLSEENQVFKFLLDATGVLTAPTLSETFQRFASFPRQYKQAVVMKQSQPTAEDARFIETVAYNRGILIRVFETREAALTWLMED